MAVNPGGMKILGAGPFFSDLIPQAWSPSNVKPALRYVLSSHARDESTIVHRHTGTAMVDATWRVLVIDDSAVTGTIVESILRACGFANIECATDGARGLELLRARHFDLVLCDWEMPRMDGVGVLRRVRQDPALQHTRFILMSANKEDGWTRLAVDADADALLVKPFRPEALKEKLGRLPMRRRPTPP